MRFLVKFRTGKGGRKKLTSLIEWMDSIKWIGYAKTDEQISKGNAAKHPEFKDIVYTLVCSGRVGYPVDCESYSFTCKEKNRVTELSINVVTNVASMNYGHDRITNVQMRFSEDSNMLQFFSPLINRIEKLNKLEQDDERLKVCDIMSEETIKMMKKFNINIFDLLREGTTIRFVDDPEHRN